MAYSWRKISIFILNNRYQIQLVQKKFIDCLIMILTPLQAFLKWEKQTPDHTFLKQPIEGVWHTYTYQEAAIEVRKIAKYLHDSVPPKSNIAILSKNCAHWLMADLAIMMAGHVSVPIYPTLSANGVRQILDHSEARIVFIGKLDNYSSQKEALAGLQKISFPFYGPQEGKPWDEILNATQPASDLVPPGSDELATIMYSSGTTGTPKGVMLTHGAFGFVGERVGVHLGVRKAERFFSYLPLSHIAERGLMEMVAISTGSTISFAESLDKFADNLRHEEPTIFGGVPRIYAKFQEGILKKLPQQKIDKLMRIPIVNSIVRNSIRKKLGLSKARVIVSGAAPTPVSLLEWFMKLRIEVCEMYGMTENTAFSHANYPSNKIGTVGKAWPEAEVKISEEGEILIRHAALMTGYYKDQVTTDSVFTNEGFLKTGDQGSIDAEGFLTITGRVKDQFKTDKAKFIAPAPIELKLLANTDIEQVCVVGMGIPQPIALTVLSALGSKKSKEEISATLSNQISAVNAELESYEQLAKVIIVKEPWTIENGLMTPSMKVKRNEIEKIFLSRYPQWYKQKGVVIWE
jgi:long-chain acyl-CoA synthetase